MKLKRNILLFFTGMFTSKLGTQIYSFAISLFVLKYTDSAALFSLSLLVNLLPQVLLSPIAGVIADKGNKKRLVVIMDFMSGLTMFALLIYSMGASLNLVVIYIASFFLAVFNSIFSTSFSSAIPELVTDEHLVKINSLKSVSESLTMILGPIIGGVIYALVDIKMFILINGISFVLSGISEMFIDFKLNSRTREREEGTKTSIIGDMKEAIVYIKKDKYISSLILYIMFINFFGSTFSVVFPYATVNVMGMSDIVVGIANGSFAVGMLAMSIYLSTKTKFKNPTRALAFGMMGIGSGFILMGLTVVINAYASAVSTYMVIILGCIIGATIIAVNIPFSVSIQQRVDPNFLGRLSGFLGSLSMLVMPVSTILSGLILELVDTTYVFGVSGLFLVLISLKLVFDKNVQTATLETEVV